MNQDSRPSHRPCPTCSEPADLRLDNEWRPFCTERCQQLDLARWLDGDYVIPGAETDDSPPSADSSER